MTHEQFDALCDWIDAKLDNRLCKEATSDGRFTSSTLSLYLEQQERRTHDILRAAFSVKD